MIYVFHGEDGFSSAEALAPLLEVVGPPDMRESNVTRMDAGEFTAGAGFRIPLSDVTVHADYAFMTHPDLGDAQRLSLTGSF